MVLVARRGAHRRTPAHGAPAAPPRARQQLPPYPGDSKCILLAPGSEGFIRAPFYCDYGYNISLGRGTFLNFDCVILDLASVRIGCRTLIGPKVQLLTAHHPFDVQQRAAGLEAGRPIEIGDDCWLGGGVIVCPGVRIGNRVIIGAGAVVTRDIPDDSVAVGNPARVIRTQGK